MLENLVPNEPFKFHLDKKNMKKIEMDETIF